LNRKYLGFDLSPEYIKIAQKRLEDSPLEKWLTMRST